MGSNGTQIKLRKPILYFDNVDIENKAQAESLENKICKDLDELKGEFLSLAMATPKDICPKDEEPINYIKEQVEELFDSLYESYYDYFTTRLVNEIIDLWEYSYDDHTEIYENCKSDEEVNKMAFPVDEHEEIKRDPNKFTFAPPDDCIGDALDRSQRNIWLNQEISDFITNKYVIITHGKVYSEYDGQFLFKSKKDAEEALKKKFDFHGADYISKEFINEHPNFFESVIRLMEYLGYDIEYIDKFTKAVNAFADNDYKFDMELMEIIYQGLNNISYERLCNMCGIHICKLGDLTK